MLHESPILRFFSWSPLVLSALPLNADLISPSFAAVPDALPDTVPDLLAMHIRRGDYDEHCYNLGNGSARFMGWNNLPGQANGFDPPLPSTMDIGGNPPDQEKLKEMAAELKAQGVNIDEIYRKHCFPSIEEIVNRTMEAKNAWEGWDAASVGVSQTNRTLRRVYIATNGKREWAEELKEALWNASDWEAVVSSRDVELTNEQVYVAQAVDMAIAERAAVFIGNGVRDDLLRLIHPRIWKS